ncbi:hypothetical protein BH09BAC2_BH09BAC2_23640 [soil metagenome]
MLYLKHDAINKIKWDDCIAHAANSLIYARSAYLDKMCGKWDALIADDYSWVFPVTFRKKYGIKYLYQPAFTQQSGVFSSDLTTVPWLQIFSFLQKEYKFWEINFNYGSPVNFFPQKIKYLSSSNFILKLNRPYQIIASEFQGRLKRTLKQSDIGDLFYKVCSTEEGFKLFKNLYSKRLSVTEYDFNNFHSLCITAEAESWMIGRKVIDLHGITLATSIFFKDENRVYNIMPAVTSDGRKVFANHFLLNEVIREFAEQPLILDFEGSEIPGVKEFYEQFGGKNQPYFRIKFNQLTIPWKWFKK